MDYDNPSYVNSDTLDVNSNSANKHGFGSIMMFNNGINAVEKNAVKVNNVSFGYGKNTMIENLNLHVDKCSIYGLIGNSGAGKLKLIQFNTK